MEKALSSVRRKGVHTRLLLLERLPGERAWLRTGPGAAANRGVVLLARTCSNFPETCQGVSLIRCGGMKRGELGSALECRTIHGVQGFDMTVGQSLRWCAERHKPSCRKKNTKKSLPSNISILMVEVSYLRMKT